MNAQPPEMPRNLLFILQEKLPPEASTDAIPKNGCSSQLQVSYTTSDGLSQCLNALTRLSCSRIVFTAAWLIGSALFDP
jgi:hypothetical protein